MGGVWFAAEERRVARGLSRGCGGCGGTVERLGREALAGRGALAAVKMGGAASCGRGGLRPSGVCGGLRLAKVCGAAGAAAGFVGGRADCSKWSQAGGGEAERGRVASRAEVRTLAGREDDCFLRRVLVEFW